MSSTDTPDTPDTPEMPEPEMAATPEAPATHEETLDAAETEAAEVAAAVGDDAAEDGSDGTESAAATDDADTDDVEVGEVEVAEPVAAGGTPLTQTTGRRKESIARLRLRPGTGKITVNDRPFEQYFATAAHRMEATEPLRVLEGADERYDVEVTIIGGGVRGQAGAMRMALARSLAAYEPEHRVDLKHAGLLTRDARRKESKKYGLVKARKAKQFTKR